MPRGASKAKPEVKSSEGEEPEVAETSDAAGDPEAKSAGRRETFEATRPDGTVVIVDRNIDTGEQTVTEK